MQLPEALRRAPVTGISVSEKKNMLRVELSPAAYIPMQILSALEKDLAGYTEGQQLAICCTYPPEAFCAEALELIEEKLRRAGEPINGFFSGASAQYDRESNTFSLTMFSGAEFLTDLGLPAKLAAEIARTFGVCPAVVLREDPSLSCPADEACHEGQNTCQSFRWTRREQHFGWSSSGKGLHEGYLRHSDYEEACAAV